LPYKQPISTAALLQKIVNKEKDSDDLSSAVPTLKHIIVIDRSGSSIKHIHCNITIDYNTLVVKNQGSCFPVQGEIDPDDIINIQFTSGTTSSPKAACLTHRNILNNGYFVGEGMELTEHDIVCCPPPLYHCFGLVLGLLAVMTHGRNIFLFSFSRVRFCPDNRCFNRKGSC
jgi:acyl-CoA synthetase (AMP-forming)/AMP-acid ligase II